MQARNEEFRKRHGLEPPDFWRSELGSLSPRQIADRSKEIEAKFERDWIDRFSDIRKFVAGKNLTPQEDPYIAIRNYAGRSGKIKGWLCLSDGLGPIIHSAYKRGILDDARQYALLDRFDELQARGIKKFPKGLTPEQIPIEKAAFAQSMGPQRMAQINTLLDRLRDFQDRLVQESVAQNPRDAGFLSRERYGQMRQKNQRYVPLQRLAYIADHQDQLHPGSNIFSVSRQDLLKKIEGSEKEVLDPLQAIIRNIYKTVGLVERNKVAVKMANLADRPEFQGLVVRLRGKQAAGPGMDTFSAFRNGIMESYAAPKVVVDALRNVNEKEADIMTRMMGWSGSALRAGATSLNVAFIPANFLRDFQSASLRARAMGVPFTPLDWLKGFAHAVKQDSLFDEYLKSGAAFGGMLEQYHTLPATLKDLTGQLTLKKALTIVNPLHYVKALGEMTEMATRLGVYGKAKKVGLPEEMRAYASRESTVDFSKYGYRMRFLNTWVPFLNARTQGTLNIFRSVRDKPVQSMAVTSLMIGLPAVLSYLSNVQNFPDVWKEIPDYEKDNYFIGIYGREQDSEGNFTQVVKIPKGDIGQLFGNPINNFLDWMTKNDPKTITQLALETGSYISPVGFMREDKFSPALAGSSLLPPAAKAVAEGITGTNLYTGRPIVPPNIPENASAEQKYRWNTPPLAVKLGQFFHVSPLIVYNTVGTLFGGLGRQIINPVETHGQLSKRFLQAHGGATQTKQFEERKEVRREDIDAGLIVRRNVDKLWNDLSTAPVEKRWEIFNAWREPLMRADEHTQEINADAFRAKVEKELGGTSDYEQSLRRSMVTTRAKIALRAVDKLPMEQRRPFLSDWLDKGIITEDVVDEMARLYNSGYLTGAAQ